MIATPAFEGKDNPTGPEPSFYEQVLQPSATKLQRWRLLSTGQPPSTPTTDLNDKPLSVLRPLTRARPLSHPLPNSQPVSFLISSSSSSRSNVEARDPITEPGAPSGAGASEATAAAGGREGGKGERPRGQEPRGQCFYCGPEREPRGGKGGRSPRTSQ